jgi:hypothetical protein
MGVLVHLIIAHVGKWPRPPFLAVAAIPPAIWDSADSLISFKKLLSMTHCGCRGLTTEVTLP